MERVFFRGKVWAVLAMVMGSLCGAGEVGAQTVSNGVDVGTEYVPIKVVIIGPVITCGKARLPNGVNYNGLNGCPAAIEVVPGHYRPVPKKNWRLTRYTMIASQVYKYECVNYRLLGFIPITVSEECLGPHGPIKGLTVVQSWEAVPAYLAKREGVSGEGGVDDE